MSSRVLRLKGVKEATGLSRSSLYALQQRGIFPQHLGVRGPARLAVSQVGVAVEQQGVCRGLHSPEHRGEVGAGADTGGPARTPRRRQRPVPVRSAHRNAKLGPAHRHPRTAPRTRARRRRARLTRRGTRTGPRQPQAGPLRRRSSLREAPCRGRSHLRRSRRAGARTEARRLAGPVARAELVAEHGTVRLPPHRRPAGV